MCSGGDSLRQDLKLSPIVAAWLSLTHESAKAALWFGLLPGLQKQEVGELVHDRFLPAAPTQSLQGRPPQGNVAAAGMERWQAVGANSCFREPKVQVCTHSNASPLILSLAILMSSPPLRQMAPQSSSFEYPVFPLSDPFPLAWLPWVSREGA